MRALLRASTSVTQGNVQLILQEDEGNLHNSSCPSPNLSCPLQLKLLPSNSSCLPQLKLPTPNSRCRQLKLRKINSSCIRQLELLGGNSSWGGPPPYVHARPGAGLGSFSASWRGPHGGPGIGGWKWRRKCVGLGFRPHPLPARLLATLRYPPKRFPASARSSRADRRQHD